MGIYLVMEDGDVTMKVAEKYAINKMNFKKLFKEGKIDDALLKYIPIKQKKRNGF